MTSATTALRRPDAPPATPPRSRVDDAMTRYAAGDDGAFAEVYAFVAPRVQAYLRRRLRDEARVPDLVQLTFLHLHRARHTFIAGAEVLPWAFAIARRQLVDAYRAAERDARLADEAQPATAPTGEELLAAKEAARRLQRALARLTPPQRAAFDLIKGEGLSLAAAAAALGTTVTALKLRTHRAYTTLRLALSP